MIKIHKFKIGSVGREADWVSINMTPEEGLALAESIVRQVRTRDPNTNRPEPIVLFEENDSGTQRVRFTVFVDENSETE